MTATPAKGAEGANVGDSKACPGSHSSMTGGEGRWRMSEVREASRTAGCLAEESGPCPTHPRFQKCTLHDTCQSMSKRVKACSQSEGRGEEFGGERVRKTLHTTHPSWEAHKAHKQTKVLGRFCSKETY